MYIVSERLSLASAEELERLERETGVRLPAAYREFMTSYGEGTYCNWINVTFPDPEVLPPFAEYGLWQHEADSPIAEEQLLECVSLGSSVNGDFLAVHPQTDGLLWLPRHDEEIVLVPCLEGPLARTLDKLYERQFGLPRPEPAYFEPWNGESEHVFFRFTGQSAGGVGLPALAERLRTKFPPDLLEENEYTCKCFYQALGGYVRFNYAIGTEIAVFYGTDRRALYEEIADFLQRQPGVGLFPQE